MYYGVKNSVLLNGKYAIWFVSESVILWHAYA